jgi:hypothetical protein
MPKRLNQNLASQLLQCNSSLMGLIDALKSAFGTLRLDSPASARAFLESRSAYLVQKSISEYSQARANMMFSTLLGEKEFAAAYDRARWQSYPAGLSMVAEVMAGAFRQRLSLSAADASAVLTVLVQAIINNVQAHGDLDWQAAAQAISQDLARAEMGEPHAAHNIVPTRARAVFDALPFHAALKKHDFSMFKNTLSFHLTEIAAELEGATLTDGAAKLSILPSA